TLSRIEGDQACPRPSTLRKIAHALAVPVTELTAELRAFTPPAPEDDVLPMATLQALSAGEPADLLLEAREPLQRIAEDVRAGLEADNAGVIATLDCLAKDAARIQGPLAVHGHALALFLAALREETIEHQPDAGVAQAREAVQLLITAIQAKPLGN